MDGVVELGEETVSVTGNVVDICPKAIEIATLRAVYDSV